MSFTPPSLGGGSYDVRRGVVHGADGGPLDVAIMTIRDDARNTRKPLARRLAAALMNITHPSVERLLRADYPGQDGFCLVTPWPDGGDLRAYLGATAAADVLDIARMIAAALGHLHESTPCVVLGNLDLSSVFMHDRTPRIWDFTLCRLDPAPGAGPLADPAPAVRVGDREGMLTAMAPELYGSGIVSTASDVYPLGILLFELFARHRPFPSSGRLAAAALLYGGKRPSRAEVPPGPCGDAVWAIIARCWAQDPADRPNIAQVAMDLHLVP